MKKNITYLEGKEAKKMVKGVLKSFIGIYCKDTKEIGCRFSGEFEEEIDRIESDKNCNVIFTSKQHSDKGQRPIEMLYEPCEGVKWEDFVTTLEKAFKTAFK